MKRTVEERIALGEWAKSVLEHPNFTAVMNGLVADGLVELMATKPGSPEAQNAHTRLLAADDFKNALSVLQGDAAVARKEIENRNRANR